MFENFEDLQCEFGGDNLSGIRIYHDFKWEDIFHHSHIAFQHGKCLISRIKKECPSDKTPALILTDNPLCEEFLIENDKFYALVVNIEKYLKKSKYDFSANYLANSSQIPLTNAVNVKNVINNPTLLTAILEKAINIEQIGIWASSGAERWLQLQSLLRSNNIETQSKPPDANTLIQNLKWLAEHTDYNSVTSIISQINDDDLKKLQSATGILHFKNLLKIWEENKTNDDELFWQEVFSNRSEIISQVFSYPVVVLKDKAYVGGKLINNLGGKVADYLYQNKNTKNAIIVEIKTPMTRLLKSEYRPNVYSVSEDLSGSVNQTLLYVNSLLKDYYSLDRDESSRFEANNPRSLLIIGSFENEGIVGEKKKSFETFRNDLRNIDVITFNELFGKIAILLTLLQQSEIISE